MLKLQDKDNDRVLCASSLHARKYWLTGLGSAHAFKLPNRVTLNDQKREAWVADLANANVPLAKLAKSVPHGYRGEKLLEMLIQRNVPVNRAAWYIQVVGASEIVSLSAQRCLTHPLKPVQHNQKSRSGASASVYTQEWTAVICDAITKLIAEIPLPSTNVVLRAGMSIKTKAKSVLSDPDMRKKWLSKLAYVLVCSSFRLHELNRIQRSSVSSSISQ